MAGEEDDHQLRPALAKPFLDLQAIEPGNRHLQHQTGGTPVALLGEKLLRAHERPNPQALGAEQSRQGLQRLGLVVEQVDDRFIRHDAVPSLGSETVQARSTRRLPAELVSRGLVAVTS